jgi:hypothetical protein
VLAKGSSKNATRRDIFAMDLESSSNVLKIYKSKRQYSSVVINLIYLTLDIILKIIDNKNSKILQWLGVYIKFKVVTGLRLKRIKAKHPDLFYNNNEIKNKIYDGYIISKYDARAIGHKYNVYIHELKLFSTITVIYEIIDFNNLKFANASFIFVIESIII